MRIHYEYITSLADFAEVVSDLLESPTQWLGCDTETTGLDCHLDTLSLIQIASKDKVYLLDVFVLKGWHALFQRLISQGSFNWSFHNFKFDLKFFWKEGIDFHGSKIVDTMIVSQLLTAGLGLDNDLASVAERYLQFDVDKTEQKSDWTIRPLSESQKFYAAKDAYTSRLLGIEMVKLLAPASLVNVFKLEMRALYSFASMEYYGMRIDLDRLEMLRPIYEERLNASAADVYASVPNRLVRRDLLGTVVDYGLDLKSPGQVLSVLRQAGIPNPLYDPKGRTDEVLDPIITSTGSTVLKLLDIGDYPLLESLLGYRKASKLLDAYVYSLPGLVNSATGNLHTNFRQIVSTGRASSSSPNLQNLARPDGSELNLRSCFVPQDGYILCDSDFSQIELRVMAEVVYALSGDKTMLQEFLDGKDPYAATAALMTGLRYEDIVDENHTILKQYKHLRQNAKAVRLGYNYGMGHKKFKAYAKATYGVSFTMEEAKANRQLYFSAYPGLQAYHDTFSDKSLRAVYTQPPYSRPRFFDEYPGIPAMANAPIQGTSADIQKLSQALMYEQLYRDGYSPTQSHDVRQLCTIHDEIVSECLPEYQEYTCNLQEKSMKDAANTVLRFCPIDADCNVIANLAMK